MNPDLERLNAQGYRHLSPRLLNQAEPPPPTARVRLERDLKRLARPSGRPLSAHEEQLLVVAYAMGNLAVRERALSGCLAAHIRATVTRGPWEEPGRG